MIERLKEYSGEILHSHFPELKKIKRRDLIGAGLISFPFATIASYLSSDIPNMREGIPVVEAKNANFWMLYEVHDKGIAVSDLPKSREIDLLWREGVPTNNVKFGEVDPLELASAVGVSGEILEYCRNRGTRVGLGDVKVPKILQNHYLELAHAVGAASLLCLSQGLQKELEKGQKLDILTKTTRRGLIGLGAVSGSIMAYKALSSTVTFVAENTEWPARDKLILRRIYGLMSNLFPENTDVFFRNVVWANKLLTLASEIREEKGRGDAEIVCNVGGGHSGLQDFLKLGSGFCRRIITSYPDWFLAKAVDLNGGIEGLTSTVVVDFRQDQFGSQKELITSMIDDKVLAGMIKGKIGENDY